MVTWVVYAVITVVMTALSYYAAMKAQKSNSITPGEVEQPTVNQGDRVPKLFGTRMVTDPKVVWVDNVRTTAIKK